MRDKGRIRVLLAKPGLDGHDRGVKVLALGLREEGLEVVYTGLRQTPEDIVRTALQEDVDVIGLSSLSGAHNAYFPRVAELAAKSGLGHVLLVGGGIIPEEDGPYLKERGMKAVFGPGSTIGEIVDFIRKNIGSGRHGNR